MLWNKTPKHKLVVIGDSISQGFKNGGVYRTDLNFPALLSRCFEPEPEFHQPSFTAQAGIPINLEMLVRGLSDQFGDTLEWNEYLPAASHLYSTLKRIKKYWEGKLSPLSNDRSKPYHNQSVWGFAMNDAWIMTESLSREHILTQKETYSIFDVLPDHALFITACMVLNPSFGEKFTSHTQIDNARYLQDNGGIENLIVSMGHNNIIGAVTDLRFQYSEPSDLDALPADRNYTVYRPEHFEMEYRKLAERVSKIDARRIFATTIPYVTIPPVSRGVNEDLSRHKGGYFDYYTRFWIWDNDFDPEKHPHLAKEQAIELDQVVDEYNRSIRTIADEFGWVVVPMNKYVSAIANRRRAGNIRIPFPDDFREAMLRHPATAHLLEDPYNPKLTSEYIRIDEEKKNVYKGGIFSLDGIHPTTIGYGLMAYVYFETMKKNGVKFDKPLDWDFIIKNDTLVTDPPYLLVELKDLLRFLSMGRQEKITKIGKSVLGQLMEAFSQRRRMAEGKKA
ncbi:MAG: hypothetical protein R3224_10505 [Balneolaceae bacterium]|nr:hypothetical protein [Balneolaceae bacterium]